MNIQITYFAILREQTGVSKEERCFKGKTVRDVFSEVQLHHGITLTENQIKVAVNDQFTTLNHILKEGDKVVFIPPVAGG